jgi:hypothetical protein
VKTIACKTCGQPFERTNWNRKYCSPCRDRPSVYRYICPDGRSYVGSACWYINTRDAKGINRSNARLKAAFEQYLPETWTFEVLEQLQPGQHWELLEAEQRHIDRLRTLSPEFGFNMAPALPRYMRIRYRAGRDELLAEVGERMGGSVLCIEI